MAFTNFGGNQGVPGQQVAPPQSAPQQFAPQQVGPPIDRAGSEEEKKQGLLGRIFSNPYVQSVGMAAMFGSPLAGLLVGPQIIKQGRSLAKAGNEERRYQLELRQRKDRARERLPGLLGGQQGQIAQSLLDIGGPGIAPGLLQATMPQQRTNTTTQKLDAFRQEGIDRGLTGQPLLDFIDAGMKGRDDILERIFAGQEQTLNEQRIEAGNQEQEDRAAEKLGRRNAASSALSTLLEVSDINAELESLGREGGGIQQAFTEPGSIIPPGLQRMGTGAAAAFGNENADRLRGLQDRFDLVSPQLAFDRMGTGLSVTNQTMFRNLTSTKPSRQTVGSANDAVTKDHLRALLLLPDMSQEDKQLAMEGIQKIDERERQRGERPPTLKELQDEQARRDGQR